MKKIVIPFVVLIAACSSQSPTETTTAHVASTDTVSKSAVEEPAQEVNATSGATAAPNRTSFNGILVTTPQNHATVTLTMGGSIRSTSLLPGAYVKKGTVLVTLENPEFITLQQTYLDSHAQYEFLHSEFQRQQTLSREEALLKSVISRARQSIFRCVAVWMRRRLSLLYWGWTPPLC